MKDKKAFCKGILCRPSDRRFKCADCGIKICKLCSITSMVNKRNYCPQCYLKTFAPDWDKLNKEFEEMLLIKDDKKTYDSVKV